MEMMAKKTQKMFAVLIGVALAIALMIGFMPQVAETVYATDGTVTVKYIDRVWDSGKIIESVGNQECTEVTSSDGDVTWDSEWYAITQPDTAINGNIEYSEDVNLVLCDDATLTITGTIEGSKGKSISIYEGSSNTWAGKITGNGALVVTSPSEDAILLSGNGSVNIKGGSITAKRTAGEGAAIRYASGSINIWGGIVETEGCLSGGGMMGVNNASETNIYGGTVFAKSGNNEFGSGIRSGKININGGTVISTGNEFGLYGVSGIEIRDGMQRYHSTDGTTWSPIDNNNQTAKYAAIGVPVAEVNSTGYPSLAVAMSKCGANETIQLIGDIITNATTTIPDGKSVKLDLNDHGIMYAGSENASVFSIDKGGTLTIKDTSEKTPHYITLKDGRGTAVSSDGSTGAIAVIGGYITGGTGTVEDDHTNGGGVNNAGVFFMLGGTIAGNTADFGGGVYTMYDFQIDGSPEIRDNSKNNVYLPEGERIMVAGPLTNANPIGVTMKTPGKFTEKGDFVGKVSDYKDRFAADDGDYIVSVLNDDAENLQIIRAYPLWVGDTQMTIANAETGIPGNVGEDPGKATYDAATNTLTLNDYKYKGQGHTIGNSETNYGSAAIYYEGEDELTIELVGENSITQTADNSLDNSFGMCIKGTFSEGTRSKVDVIQGTGSLTVNNEGFSNTTGVYGIFSNRGLMINMKGKLDIICDNGTAEFYHGIYTSLPGFTISDGSIKVRSGNSAQDSYGIYGATDEEGACAIEITGGTVDVTSGNSAKDDSWAIIGDSFVANGFGVSIQGGTVTARSGETGDGHISLAILGYSEDNPENGIVIGSDLSITKPQGGRFKNISLNELPNETIVSSDETPALDVLIERTSQKVANEIENLPDPVTLADKDQVDSVKKDFDALTESQKGEISEKLVQKLDKAVDTIAVLLVSDQIAKLPEPVTLDDEEAVDAAVKAYLALTDSQKAVFPEMDLQKLIKAETAIGKLRAKGIKVKMRKVKNLKGRKVRIQLGKPRITSVKGKEVTGISGYYIKYSTNKKLKKRVKSKKIKNPKTRKVIVKKLKKGKTYYFRACTYTKVTNRITNETITVKGKWSAKKKVKIKK